MPEGVLALLVVPLVELQFGVLHDGTVQLYGLTVHSAAEDAACQSRRDALGNLKSGCALLIRANRAVREGNVNHIYNICFNLSDAKVRIKSEKG